MAVAWAGMACSAPHRNAGSTKRALAISMLLLGILLTSACAVVHTPPPGPTATATPARPAPPPLVYLTSYGLPAGGSSLAVMYYVTALNPADGSVRWRVPLSQGEAILGAPIVADGNVYVDSYTLGAGASPVQAQVTALDRETGLVRWRYHAGPNFEMAAGNGVLYLSYTVPTQVVDHQVLALGGGVVALDAASGARRWQITLDGPAGIPLVAGSQVYLEVGPASVGSGGTWWLTALDAGTGAVRWRYASTAVMEVDAVANGLVYGHIHQRNRFGQPAETLVALDAARGGMRWQYPTGGEPDVPLVVDGALYFVATLWPTDPQAGGQNVAVAASLDARTGQVRWHMALTYGPTQLAVANGTVYLACANAATPATSVTRLLALQAGDGTIRWRDQVGSFQEVSRSTAPVVSEGVVYVYTLPYAAPTAPGAGLMALDGQTGAHRWAAPVLLPDALTGGHLQVADGRVFALTRTYRPHMVAVAAQSGAVVWHYDESNGTVLTMTLGA